MLNPVASIYSKPYIEYKATCFMRFTKYIWCCVPLFQRLT